MCGMQQGLPITSLSARKVAGRRWCALSLRRRRMPTYAGVCWHMLTYADVCCMLQAGDGARCVFAAGGLGPQRAGQRYAHALYWWWSRLRSPAVLHTYVHKHNTHARTRTHTHTHTHTLTPTHPHTHTLTHTHSHHTHTHTVSGS
jgi:hypothetical protein